MNDLDMFQARKEIPHKMIYAIIALCCVAIFAGYTIWLHPILLKKRESAVDAVIQSHFDRNIVRRSEMQNWLSTELADIKAQQNTVEITKDEIAKLPLPCPTLPYTMENIDLVMKSYFDVNIHVKPIVDRFHMDKFFLTADVSRSFPLNSNVQYTEYQQLNISKLKDQHLTQLFAGIDEAMIVLGGPESIVDILKQLGYTLVDDAKNNLVYTPKIVLQGLLETCGYRSTDLFQVGLNLLKFGESVTKDIEHLSHHEAPLEVLMHFVQHQDATWHMLTQLEEPIKSMIEETGHHVGQNLFHHIDLSHCSSILRFIQPLMREIPLIITGKTSIWRASAHVAIDVTCKATGSLIFIKVGAGLGFLIAGPLGAAICAPIMGIIGSIGGSDCAKILKEKPLKKASLNYEINFSYYKFKNEEIFNQVGEVGSLANLCARQALEGQALNAPNLDKAKLKQLALCLHGAINKDLSQITQLSQQDLNQVIRGIPSDRWYHYLLGIQVHPYFYNSAKKVRSEWDNYVKSIIEQLVDEKTIQEDPQMALERIAAMTGIPHLPEGETIMAIKNVLRDVRELNDVYVTDIDKWLGKSLTLYCGHRTKIINAMDEKIKHHLPDLQALQRIVLDAEAEMIEHMDALGIKRPVVA